MPFPTTKVIPDGWSRHHAPTATGGMNATVTVSRADGQPVWDPETDDTVQARRTLYDGPARIQALNQASTTDQAGQPITGRPYLVQLDMGVDETGEPVLPGDRVRPTDVVNDASLIGDDLWVIDVQKDSERFTRDLICSDNMTDTPSKE